jgi:transcriptional regulator with XRE-family HTH domain
MLRPELTATCTHCVELFQRDAKKHYQFHCFNVYSYVHKLKVANQSADMRFESPLCQLLRAAIWARYKKIPSNAFLANQFNLRSSNCKSVSQESFRRWMLGESMPDYQHLRALIGWLGLDANQIFNGKPIDSQPRTVPDAEPWLEPIIYRWEQKLTRLTIQKSQLLADLIDRILSLEPGKTEKTYTNFSDLLASTRSATAGPGARENSPHSPEGSSATFEKIGPRSGS